MDDTGFKKIEFDVPSPKENIAPTPQVVANESGKIDLGAPIRPMKKKFFGRKGVKIGAVVIAFLALVLLYTGIQSVRIIGQARKTYAQAKLAAAAAKAQNVVLAKDELVKTKTETEKLQKDLNSVGYLRFVPFLGGYVSDATHATGAGVHGINAAIITADSLIPYADVLGLKGDKSFSGGSAQSRIQLAVQSLDKITPRIDDIEKEINAAKVEMDQVNVNHYPNFWIFANLHNQVQNAKDLTDGAALAVSQGKPLIKVLPELLGSKSPKKYLVLFQNDKELRSTGGFLTFYSIFSVDKGVIHVDSSHDIYSLDDSIPSHPKADPIILKYLPKVYTQNIRDINLSPDFPTSMNAFAQYYDKSSQKTDYDGIIAIDTQFMVNLIKILGSVDADGQTFTANIDPACNCPQVVYQLEQNTTKPVNYIKTNRKGIVGDLLFATMQKALSSSPKLYWGPLIQSTIKDAQEKHVLFYLKDKGAQSGIEALNWAGQVKPFDGDYLYVNDANFGGAKSNMYVKQDMQIDYNVASDGQVTKTLTINYKNPQKYSDCNLESGGLCLNAILRNFQRVYVPKGSTLDSSKGSQVKVETKQDLGKTYFESFFTVNPLGLAKMEYTYKLPFKVKGNTLPVMLQKQPGVEDVPTVINVNGRQVDSFDLRSDKILNLKI